MVHLGLFIDLVGRRSPVDDAPHGVDDLGPAAVVEGDREGEAGVVLGELHALVHAPDESLRDSPVAASDETDPDVAGVELVLAAQKDLFVEVDQEAHFILRALPWQKHDMTQNTNCYLKAG